MHNSAHSHGNLQKIIAAIGVFLIAISLYCSFLLYTSFSDDGFDKAAWGGMGLGLDAFKNVALVAAIALWSLGYFASRMLSVLVFVAYVVLTVLSFIAFFGFMSTVQHKLETESYLASSQYRSINGQIEKAEKQVEMLSRYANSDAVAHAEQQLHDFAPQLAAAQAAVATWVNPDGSIKTDRRGLPYTTKAREAQAALAQLKQQTHPWQTQVDGYQRYQAAVAHHAQLLEQQANLGGNQVALNTTYLHPMFVDLGKLISAAPDEAKVAFMFISAFAAEVLGTLSILIAFMLNKRRSYTLEEIEVMSVQLRDQHARLQTALAATHSIANLSMAEHTLEAGQITPKLANQSRPVEKQPPASTSDVQQEVTDTSVDAGTAAPTATDNKATTATTSTNQTAIPLPDRSPVEEVLTHDNQAIDDTPQTEEEETPPPPSAKVKTHAGIGSAPVRGTAAKSSGIQTDAVAAHPRASQATTNTGAPVNMAMVVQPVNDVSFNSGLITAGSVALDTQPLPPKVTPLRPTVATPHANIELVEPGITVVENVLRRGQCAPTIDALQRQFALSYKTAQDYLTQLAQAGLLQQKDGYYHLKATTQPVKPQTKLNRDMCSGIECEQEDNRVRIFFPNPQATLPVVLRNGDICWMPWGKRQVETYSAMPNGGWARLDSIKAGKWNYFTPRPVLIPALRYMEKDPEGTSHWFDVDSDTMIQGLLAQKENEQRIYVVTVDAPKDLAHIHPRAPRLVNKQEVEGMH